MKNFLDWFFNSSNRLVFAGVLFLAGVIAWGAFNTFMEYTNRMDFCIGCHEMRENVYAEYQGTVHFHNRSGVRASCSDCHVPKEWGAKLVRKIKASQELYHKVVGTIDTKEKFEEHRLEMAQRVWTEMRENGSRECKNCHSYDAMHADKQGNRAKESMKEAATQDLACIDCHKGIAHQLPKFDKVYAQWAQDVQKVIEGDPLSSTQVIAAKAVTIFSEQKTDSDDVATVSPLTTLNVLEKSGDWMKVELVGWDREGGAQLFAKHGPQYQIAQLGGAGFDVVKQTTEWVDPESELTWNQASVEGWVKVEGNLSSDPQLLKDFAQKLWNNDCSLCHTRYEPGQYNAFDWTKQMKAMRRFTHLDDGQQEMVLKFLQMQSSDMVAAK